MPGTRITVNGARSAEPAGKDISAPALTELGFLLCPAAGSAFAAFTLHRRLFTYRASGAKKEAQKNRRSAGANRRGGHNQIISIFRKNSAGVIINGSSG